MDVTNWCMFYFSIKWFGNWTDVYIAWNIKRCSKLHRILPTGILCDKRCKCNKSNWEGLKRRKGVVTLALMCSYLYSQWKLYSLLKKKHVNFLLPFWNGTGDLNRWWSQGPDSWAFCCSQIFLWRGFIFFSFFSNFFSYF